MGVVYLAEDPLLKRGVAIKVVHGGTAAQAEALRRFQQEAEVSARLSHPNVITVFDVGEEPDLGPFMAMEFVDGLSLAALLEKGPLDPEQAAHLLIQGLHALEAAHARDIIHRDFKPENLMISTDGRLKLMDFGIARTSTGQVTTDVLCTPTYAAPELLDRKPPSSDTDRWAYYVTAFWMILGALPFKAPSMSALLYAIAHDPPIFPERTSPQLRAVFLKALSKDPGSRHEDLRTFLNELLEAMPLSEDERDRCSTLLEAGTSTLLSGSQKYSRRGFFGRRGWLRLPRLAWLAAGILMLSGLAVWSLVTFSPRRLSLQTTPSGAHVFLDDVSLGLTPLADAKIPKRAYLLRLEKKGYQTLEHAVQKGERDLRLNLIPVVTRLDLITEPAGAEVFLDGLLVGSTPVTGLELSRGEAQRLLIRKPGFEPWSMSVSRGKHPPSVIRLKRTEPATPRRQPLWKRLFQK